MRKSLITIGALALFAATPALADPSSHVIGNDDLPVSRATDPVASDRTGAANVVTLAYEPRGSQFTEDETRAFDPDRMDTIGGDD